jgi:hypothetical protein
MAGGVHDPENAAGMILRSPANPQTPRVSTILDNNTSGGKLTGPQGREKIRNTTRPEGETNVNQTGRIITGERTNGKPHDTGQARVATGVGADDAEDGITNEHRTTKKRRRKTPRKREIRTPRIRLALQKHGKVTGNRPPDTNPTTEKGKGK